MVCELQNPKGEKRVTNQEENDDQKTSRSQPSSGSNTQETGDPGRTPGTAEGDEQTIDEDLRQKDKEEQK